MVDVVMARADIALRSLALQGFTAELAWDLGIYCCGLLTAVGLGYFCWLRRASRLGSKPGPGAEPCVGEALGRSPQAAEPKPVPTTARRVDLNVVIRDSSHLLEGILGEDVELTVRLASVKLPITLGLKQLQQMLVNLADHAQGALPAGGKLAVQTQLVWNKSQGANVPGLAAGQYAILTVRYMGPGMNTDLQARRSEHCVTSNRHRPETEPALDQIKDAVASSGGRLVVNSQPDQGGTVEIYLPLAESREAVPASQPASASPRPGGETILLAEDDDCLRVLVKSVLTHQGYEVLAARDGQQALQLAAAHPRPIQLLLADVVMPQMSGRDLAVRLAEIHPGMRVLYISGYPPEARARYGVHDEEVALLPKPFTGTVLDAKIRQVLDLPAAQPV
ncbi:MAG TPA: response regulator [Gemmataceae bacterium]|nr:response regulator [Gemmataceae bacterium]